MTFIEPLALLIEIPDCVLQEALKLPPAAAIYKLLFEKRAINLLMFFRCMVYSVSIPFLLTASIPPTMNAILSFLGERVIKLTEGGSSKNLEKLNEYFLRGSLCG